MFLCSIHSVAPLLLTEPSATNATISENFTLACNASGYPVPTIVWTHIGTAVDAEEVMVCITVNECLTSVEHSDAVVLYQRSCA